MCIKQFYGYMCGHCSVPTIIPCPLTEANEHFPQCRLPAERPIHTNQYCHACMRVIWNKQVIAEEKAHQLRHEKGDCKCEVIFDRAERERREKEPTDGRDVRARPRGKARKSASMDKGKPRPNEGRGMRGMSNAGGGGMQRGMGTFMMSGDEGHHQHGSTNQGVMTPDTATRGVRIGQGLMTPTSPTQVCMGMAPSYGMNYMVGPRTNAPEGGQGGYHTANQQFPQFGFEGPPTGRSYMDSDAQRAAHSFSGFYNGVEGDTVPFGHEIVDPFAPGSLERPPALSTLPAGVAGAGMSWHPDQNCVGFELPPLPEAIPYFPPAPDSLAQRGQVTRGYSARENLDLRTPVRAKPRSDGDSPMSTTYQQVRTPMVISSLPVRHHAN